MITINNNINQKGWSLEHWSVDWRDYVENWPKCSLRIITKTEFSTLGITSNIGDIGSELSNIVKNRTFHLVFELFCNRDLDWITSSLKTSTVFVHVYLSKEVVWSILYSTHRKGPFHQQPLKVDPINKKCVRGETLSEKKKSKKRALTSAR